MLACSKLSLRPIAYPISPCSIRFSNIFPSPSGFACRAGTRQTSLVDEEGSSPKHKKKVIVVGSGWAGLGAAHHLCNQGYSVTVLQGNDDFGYPDSIGIRGYWSPFKNIFSLVDELGIKPFTEWTKSAQYSEAGLEVEFPIFRDLPQLPTPFGALNYTEFVRLPFLDRLTSLPLMAAVIDFDNTDAAWGKYDSITARELFKQFGISDRLYQDIIRPLVQTGLFASAEQCSAAATLGMLYYIILAHQKDFDFVLCRGSVKEKIFNPWTDSMKAKGCEFLERRRVTDFFFNEDTGCVSKVLCGKEKIEADAVIMAVGISTFQELVNNSPALCAREDFLKVMNLDSVDLLTVKLWLDTKVKIPNASNVCSGFGHSFGWTFFDLNAIQEEHGDDPFTVLQADFYHANELLPLMDDDIVIRVKSYLSKCIKDFEMASVVDKEIGRYPKSLTHFFPGSYKFMPRGSTSLPNLFLAGDWIVNRHGSWALEKSYVTGLEAANRVVDYLGDGDFAKIVPVEEDEPHIETLRNLNRTFNEIRSQIPMSSFFLD